MRSIDIYQYGAQLHAGPLAASDAGGDPCFAVEPIQVIAVDAAPIAIGRLLSDLLCAHVSPVKEPVDWKVRKIPILSAVGVKAWRAFAKKAKYVRLDDEKNQVTLTPSTVDRDGNFVPLIRDRIHLASPDAGALGLGVLKAMAISKAFSA